MICFQKIFRKKLGAKVENHFFDDFCLILHYDKSQKLSPESGIVSFFCAAPCGTTRRALGAWRGAFPFFISCFLEEK